MKFKSFKFFTIITILFIFNEAYAALECVQSSDSSGQTGFFVQDGTTIYNGKNGTTIKRCGMSRRDQGSQQFKETAAPPAAPKVGSVSPTLNTTDPSSQRNISFTVPTGVNATDAIVTLYSASSQAGPFNQINQQKLVPGATYSSDQLTPGSYYKANVQFLNGKTLGADVTVINPFKFTLCKGEAICNLQISGAGDSNTLSWSAVVDTSVYRPDWACIVLDNRNADKVSITPTSYKLSGTINLTDWYKIWTAAGVGTQRPVGTTVTPNLHVRLIDTYPQNCVVNSRAAQQGGYGYTKFVSSQVTFKIK